MRKETLLFVVVLAGGCSGMSPTAPDVTVPSVSTEGTFETEAAYRNGLPKVTEAHEVRAAYVAATFTATWDAAKYRLSSKCRYATLTVVADDPHSETFYRVASGEAITHQLVRDATPYSALASVLTCDGKQGLSPTILVPAVGR